MSELSEKAIAKSPTGISGLDEITGGGFPQGRPTLICGGAGCGKTLMSMQFLIKGITEFNEPGVFMSFEETASELAENVASLGYDLNELIAEKRLAIDHVRVERSEIDETGEYDLEGLFIRLAYAIDSVKAKRVVLDTIESLFSGLSNTAILRAELRRLFRWLKDQGVTALITGERGVGSLTRQGLEEYVSDCVILLDHRVDHTISTRRLRIVKYRGTTHGTNEYPFIIEEDGLSVIPITSLGLNHAVSDEHISTGIDTLDSMLNGEGYYRGSSIMVSGTAGTGKTSIASHFARACCERNERALFFVFEESCQQLSRNMRSIGIDLDKYVKKDLLRIMASRPTNQGLEMHLAAIHKHTKEFKPSTVIIDPLTSLINIGNVHEVRSMLTRLIDFFKTQLITAFFTGLSSSEDIEKSGLTVSTLMDTYLIVRDVESIGERNRSLYVMKSRGMAHSNQVREFLITPNGVDLSEKTGETTASQC